MTPEPTVDEPVAGDFFKKTAPPPLPPAPPVQVESPPYSAAALQPEAAPGQPDPQPGGTQAARAGQPDTVEEDATEPAARAGTQDAPEAKPKAPRKSGRGTQAGTSGKRGDKPKDTRTASDEDEDEAGRDGEKKVAVRVRPEIRDLMHQQRQAMKLSFTDIAIDALDLNLEAVKKQLASERPARREGALFKRTYTRRAVKDTETDTTTVQINLFLVDDDIATIETLWRDAGARDRSHLITTALEIHLKGQSAPTSKPA